MKLIIYNFYDNVILPMRFLRQPKNFLTQKKVPKTQRLKIIISQYLNVKEIILFAVSALNFSTSNVEKFS